MSEPQVIPYTPPARWIHWITAAAMLLVIPFGFIMLRLPNGPAQNQLFDLHRSIGFTILCLAVLRVAVRVVNGTPPRPPGLPDWQWAASNAVHHLLYALIFIMPLLGWAGSSAYGSPVNVFGLFTLPAIVPKDERLSDLFNGAHQYLGYATAALVTLHILAGLYHGIVRQDGVLSRMLPFLSRR
ncbi:cytochrome b [Xanthobacter sp. DSM 24535]|uniref:cytochrome b n=1 Tax=Roseixanthobacter psychrophilus TaxID=3119917 RepID=UPI003729B284